MNIITSMSPITEVHLCQGVPLDNTYRDTMTFANSSSQYAYFAGKVKTGANFTELTPSKKINTFQLPISAYSVYDCNYLMFKNANFNSKWIYAFISEIIPISINCCEVVFEMDVMQTWYFDYNLHEAFVVREHVNDDTIGANLVEESIETGEYVSNGVNHFDYSAQKVCILSSLRFSDLTTASGLTINGVYSGLDNIAGIDATDSASINAVLKKFIDAGKEDAIVAVYQYPSFAGDASTTSPVTENKYVYPNYSALDGYTPKNRKLYTYPYNFCVMSNNQGKSITYRYENFDLIDNQMEFEIDAVYMTNPVVFCFPMYHRGVIFDYDSGLTLENYPQCAWTGDAFKAWIAQNKGALALSTMSTIGTTLGGAITGNPIAVGAGLASAGGEIGKIYDHTQIPPTVHGQINTDSLNSGMDRYKFSLYAISIKHQFAKIIDDYFTRYGYKVNAVKVPNITGRPYWNYVKTIDCNVTGNIPFNDISKIRQIYDNGITFWHGDYVGIYSLNNAI